MPFVEYLWLFFPDFFCCELLCWLRPGLVSFIYPGALGPEGVLPSAERAILLIRAAMDISMLSFMV